MGAAWRGRIAALGLAAAMVGAAAGSPALAQEAAAAQGQPQAPYGAFHVAIYVRAYEVAKMADPAYLQSRWDAISRDVHVDHIYLETHRDKLLVDEATMRKAIAFFKAHGVEVSGGITWTISEPNRFQTFCYSDPADRAWVKHVAEYTASLFDDVILDDFFFTSCKSDEEIAAKQGMSWTDYRLKLMDEVARDLVVGPAKAVNPHVHVTVKYPNWYEHFQGSGFDLAVEPGIYDSIYTGTETRDAALSAQHLQPYESYQIIRYYDNIAPGRNRGGWVDPFASHYLERYDQQLALTLLAKAPEITLFDWRSMAIPVTAANRAPWQDEKPSYSFDDATAAYRGADGALRPETEQSAAAGYTFRLIAPVIAQLGNPLGVASYRPFQSLGEDFLHNYIGEIGVPIDLRTSFPQDAHTIFLTEDAQKDPNIVSEIEAAVRGGKNVVITSGLLRALQDKGLGQIDEMRTGERVALVSHFMVGYGPLVESDKPILIPQIEYLTNDSWEDASAVDGDDGWPILQDADYGKGHLFVLAVPENFSDLYHLPAPILDRIRRTLDADLFVRLQGPGKVSLFAYDNDTVVVQSFRDEDTPVGLVLDARFPHLKDLRTGEVLTGTPAPDNHLGWAPSEKGKWVFSLTLKPQSFRAFKAQE